MDLYGAKTAINARLNPVVDRMAAMGVSPDAVTLAAIPVALLASACLILSPGTPWLLLAIPFLVLVRLGLNLVDGNLARRSGRVHARGELYNEVGDRLADIAFLAPVALLPGAAPIVVMAGVLAAVLASYVGVVARAAGGERIYRGILSKPGRMALLAFVSVWAFVAGPGSQAPWAAFGPLLLIGALLTVAERSLVAWRGLE